MITDRTYIAIVGMLHIDGEVIITRNAKVKSIIHCPAITFRELPLVTVRKTAWKKALREMEWFLSGNPTCPEDLAQTWWKGQLNPNGRYWGGYGEQLRGKYDQIESLIYGLIHHPYSRRHVITTWNPADMANITVLNENPNTPTTCHTTIAQFFVRAEKLHMSTYQRSADVLLGVPHNWVQSWALLHWLAYKVGRDIGSMRWLFGDLHLYQHPTHIETAEKLNGVAVDNRPNPFHLRHTPTSSEFLADDFSIDGDIPEPVVHTKPALL